MLKTAPTFIGTIQLSSEYDQSINVFLWSIYSWSQNKKIQINNQYILGSKSIYIYKAH